MNVYARAALIGAAVGLVAVVALLMLEERYRVSVLEAEIREHLAAVDRQRQQTSEGSEG